MKTKSLCPASLGFGPALAPSNLVNVIEFYFLGPWQGHVGTIFGITFLPSLLLVLVLVFDLFPNQ